MHIQYATEPGTAGHPNEDFAGAATPATGIGGTLVVLDGVTPPAADYGCQHGVPWFTSHLGGALLELLSIRSGLDRTLADCLADAIGRTADTHRTTCDLSHPRTPQATVVLARWDQEIVEYLVLSDSVLLVAEAGGTVRPVLDTRLDALLPAARRLAPERRTASIESMRNSEGGFFTAAADPSVASLAVRGTLDRHQVRALAALTDGAGRWVETFALGGWADLFTLLNTAGPDHLIASVRAAEHADPDGSRFPRGKAHDDATALLAQL